MKYLEITGIPVTQIKGIPRIPMCKKIMKLDDYAEFVDMVVSFAERKSMTISNIKDAIQEIVTYLEDAATLNMGMKDQAYSETDGDNARVGLKYYMSNEEVIECMKNARQSLDQKKLDAKSKDGEDEFKVSEKIDESKDKDEIMAKKIFNMLLNSYAPDGISIKEVEEILRKVYKMFEYTTIIPIVEEQTSQPEQVDAQAGEYDIDRIATALSQKIQETALE